jgi:hypothetical protein
VSVLSQAGLELQGGLTLNRALVVAGSGVTSGGAVRSVLGANGLGGMLALAANTTLGVDAGASLTVSGGISGGAYQLNKTGPGVLTLGSLMLTDTSTAVIEIASAGTRGTAYDGISILDAGGLTYGGTMALAFGGSAIANDTTFDVFSFTGSSAGSLAAIESTGFYAGTWTSLGSGTFRLVSGSQTLTFSQSSGDIIVVPEPAAIALVGLTLGAGSLALLRRRRRA